MPESKNKGLGWGFFVSVGLVLFTVSLTTSLGILMMERKYSLQISFLKLCASIIKTECKVYSWYSIYSSLLKNCMYMYIVLC